MNRLKIPKLPPLCFMKCGSYTYVRTYKNKWVPSNKTGKMQAVKADLKTVGKIDNNIGIGTIHFEDFFYFDYPKLRDFTVSREKDESKANKYFLKFTPISPDAVADVVINITDKSIGYSLVVDHILSNDPLLEALQETFDNYNEILSLAYFFASDKDAVAYHYEQFARSTKLPCNRELSSSDITYLFKSITQEDILRFYRVYLNLLTKKRAISKERWWAIDSTSISTYAKLQDASYGKNKQEENLPQLNVMMVTDEITARPLFFNIFNGSIVDVSAFQNTCELLLNLGSHSFVFVADRGFFSEQNMIDIKKKGYHFAICVPHEKATSYQNYITEAIQAFATTPCYSTFYEENIYTCKERVTIGSNEHAFKAYVHVFYNAETGGAQINAYQRRLEEVRNLIFKKQTLTDENMCFAKNNFLVDENNNFILDEHNCPIVNNKVYQKTLNNTGIFLVISDTIKKPDAALKAYIKRKAIEDNFSSLKTRMNIKRLRVSSENALVGKCFIMFLAITIRTLLEKIFLKQKEKDEHSLPHKSLQKIINELRAVKEFYFSDTHNYIVKTISKKQRECFDLFSVKVPVSRYSPNLAVANEITECKKPHGDGLRER